jgi:pSer/pThr/pTyr-binding forkhead associated (FHA) protein
MQVADRRESAVEIDATKWAGVKQAPSVRHLDVVLKPLSRPELGEIRIDDAVFAIGRTEQPFASYGSDILDVLSRRHARIFREGAFIYLADLESRNGTTLNRVGVGHTPCQLRDGDEICFGGELSYRVQITPRTRPEASSLTLTLTPESGEAGLDTITITKFPFLVSKTDATFSNYKSQGDHSQELSYLSRRHAYIYQKGGQAYIEDLGSSNGTFVDRVRLVEHAVPLQDGVVVAFGGEHFVYRVSIAPESGVEPAQSGARKPLAESKSLAEGKSRMPQAVDSGKTQFMAAPTSFLDIFCGAEEPKEDVAPADPAVSAAAAKEPAVKRRPRGRVMLLLSELASLHASGEPDGARRSWWKAAAVAGILGGVILTAYFWGASDRDLKDALARGEYARAATLATQLLKKRPDDVELEAQATEAALKAYVPTWLVKVRARDFDAAKGVLTGMSELSTRDADLRPLIEELEWLGSLERLVSGRGGPDAPIRIYADEDSIERLIGRWNDDTGEHQRALARIASRVPQFGEWYGEALSHLRRLQSESTVYLAVIERVKANIATELERDNPDVLQPVLGEIAEKYPALGGLDSVRQDLARYIEIRREARTRESGRRLLALLRRARFVTPPFEQSFRALIKSGQLPPADVLQQYNAATQAWTDGNLNEALGGLQRMTAGPWGEDAAAELQRRRDVMARFAALQQSRDTDGFVDQLLAFRQTLDADEDVYFVRATAADLNLQRDKVIARAQDDMNKARMLWQEYQSDGAIDASQRIETSISDQFRSRAHSLAEAARYAQQSFLIYSQVDSAGAAKWAALRDEIESEAREQRSRLHDLSNVVEPALLKTKLALLGDLNE